MAKLSKKKQRDEMFLKLIEQANKSISESRCAQHFFNVHSGWIRRITAEYRYDADKTKQIETLTRRWRREFKRFCRIQEGSQILKSANLKEI